MYLLSDTFAWLVALVWQVGRGRRMGRFARRHDLEPCSSEPLLASGFDLVGQGGGRGIPYAFQGTWRGISVHLADYWWWLATPGQAAGRERSWYAIALTDVGVRMPRLKLEKETLYIRGEKLIYRIRDQPPAIPDVELGDPHFDACYRVVCDDREFAAELLHHDMRAWLLERGAGCEFELRGSRILISSQRRWGRLIGPEALLETLAGFCDRLPGRHSTRSPIP